MKSLIALLIIVGSVTQSFAKVEPRHNSIQCAVELSSHFTFKGLFKEALDVCKEYNDEEIDCAIELASHFTFEGLINEALENCRKNLITK